MSKETSVEVASAAARLVKMKASAMARALRDDPDFAASVRAVAASALAQREEEMPPSLPGEKSPATVGGYTHDEAGARLSSDAGGERPCDVE